MKRDMHLLPVRVIVPAGTSKEDVRAMLAEMVRVAERDAGSAGNPDGCEFSGLVAKSDFAVWPGSAGGSVETGCRSCGDDDAELDGNSNCSDCAFNAAMLASDGCTD